MIRFDWLAVEIFRLVKIWDYQVREEGGCWRMKQHLTDAPFVFSCLPFCAEQGLCADTRGTHSKRHCRCLPSRTPHHSHRIRGRLVVACTICTVRYPLPPAGTVRIWHANTYRLETTLNYGLERLWNITCLRGSNDVAFGYDDGSVMVKVCSLY